MAKELTETLELTGVELAHLVDAVRFHLEHAEADLAAAPTGTSPRVFDPLRRLDEKVRAAYASYGERRYGG